MTESKDINYYMERNWPVKIVAWEIEPFGYMASSESFPDAIGFGGTEIEAIGKAKNALKPILEKHLSQGLPIVEPVSFQNISTLLLEGSIFFGVSEKMLYKAAMLGQNEGKPFYHLFVKLLKDYCKSHGLD